MRFPSLPPSPWFLLPAVLWAYTLVSFPLQAQSALVKRLKAGEDQVVVVYGTSLSSGGNGRVWMDAVAQALNSSHRGQLKYYLSGKGGKWSTWGVQHLEDSVIKKNPDVVIIEFGINDAFKDNQTSPEVARLNLHYMIDRIKLHNPACEIILQVMNMPVNKSADYRPDLSLYYDLYRQVARKRKLLLIDHYGNWEKILKQGKDVFLQHIPDGIHPNAASGRNIIAPFILQRLQAGR
jgi:acyl-CoA thioesterase I